MGRYGSWISVSQFYVEVTADNEEEAKQLIDDELHMLDVQIVSCDKEKVYLDCKAGAIIEGGL